MDKGNNEPSASMRLLGIVVSIAMICAGGYLFFNLRSIVWIFSASVAVQGVMLVIRYLSSKNGRNGWDLIGGIIGILFGGIMLFGGTQERVAGLVAIEMYVAIWALFSGCSHIFGSFALKKLGVKGWGWTLAGGVLTAICGIIYISMPLMGTALLVGIAGIYASIAFIIFGVTGLAGALSSGGQGNS